MTQMKSSSGYYIDGGVLAFIPPIGEIRVSPLNLSRLLRSRKADISLLSTKYSFPQLLSMVLIPPSPVIMKDLFQEGIKSAEFWMRQEETRKKLVQHTAKL